MFPATDLVYYAIGDIHGELSSLLALHREIDRHHQEFHVQAKQVIVHLGDYVDRGPDSAGVIDWLMSQTSTPQKSIICLKGNHEAMMVAAVRDEKDVANWRQHGGEQTLESYRKRGHNVPPAPHLIWMDCLPSRFIDADKRLVFVHASIDPGSFPAPAEHLHLWGRREEFFDSASWSNPALDSHCVVHGHTPTDDSKPDISADRRRINVDTGACYGGYLTAVVIASGRPPAFLRV